MTKLKSIFTVSYLTVYALGCLVALGHVGYTWYGRGLGLAFIFMAGWSVLLHTAKPSETLLNEIDNLKKTD